MITKNKCYTNPKIIKPKGVMIHSVGCSQPDRNVFVNSWNNPNVKKSVHAIADNRGVTQMLPYTYKSWHAGASANNTHLSIEMTEPSCLKYNRGRVVSYNIEQGYKHFEPTLNNTIAWAGDRCLEFNLSIDTIICHADGYKLGIASNHGDVYHWWKYHNYTMDDFRQGVYDYMNKDIRYKKLEDCPDWSQKYISRLISLGYLTGYDDNLDLTDDMIRCLIVSGRMAGVF